MITWYHNTDLVYHSYQLASVGLSTVIIAKSCADHHYFETRGKSVRGELSATVSPVSYLTVPLQRGRPTASWWPGCVST